MLWIYIELVNLEGCKELIWMMMLWIILNKINTTESEAGTDVNCK